MSSSKGLRSHLLVSTFQCLASQVKLPVSFPIGSAVWSPEKLVSVNFVLEPPSPKAKMANGEGKHVEAGPEH